MKKTLLLALLALSLFLREQVNAQTFYVYQQPSPPVYFITEDPPEFNIVEVIGFPTEPNYIWIRGNWQWNGCQWVRIYPRCIPRPTPACPRKSGIMVSGCREECSH